MRLDKFLKISRIIKRRTVAKNVAENEKIMINGKVKKPSTKVKVGDIIEVSYYDKIIKFKILEVPTRNVGKKDADKLIEIIIDPRKG
ncbi:RNA-binding S4 domain-containing protein [Haliovirga abyssi]|uniref:RQC P-site tRNA stabilizing factor n=1 Tax=Haliovirga abyssi TaxID=2996794 RepID=A0AAU9DDQ8_9FUSO|nr:RNA-binding S4 domain-containing protein [Haliovirga abyssi]BDU51490.1 hypothetical protein HLVA_20590 [Haliovirga abyssi]